MIATLTFVVSISKAQTLALDRSAPVRSAAASVRARYATLHRTRVAGLPSATFDYVLNPQASNENTSIEQRAITFGLGININTLLNQSDSVRSSAGDLLSAERDYDAAVLAHRFDLIEAGGELAALIETTPDDDQLLIVNVAVKPAFQGRGLGVRLMRHAEALAAQARLKGMRLYTNKLFAANVALYEALGYRLDGEEAFPGGVVRVNMSKPLNGGGS